MSTIPCRRTSIKLTYPEIKYSIPIKSLCANCINLIYENDAGWLLFRKLKGITNKFCSISNEHLHKTKFDYFTWTQLLSTYKLQTPSNLLLYKIRYRINEDEHIHYINITCVTFRQWAQVYQSVTWRNRLRGNMSIRGNAYSLCSQPNNTFWALLFHQKPSYIFNNAVCTFLYMLGTYPSFSWFLFLSKTKEFHNYSQGCTTSKAKNEIISSL